MKNSDVYALLVGVGDYQKLHIASLPIYRMDLTLIASAIQSGLKVPEDNIRIVAGEGNDGYVEVKDIARAISGFKSLMPANATFLFYFSGHGGAGHLVFSNGELALQSVIDYIDALPVKNKLIMLDCCYAGAFQTSGAKQMEFEDTVADFAGHGIALLASSAANEVSRLGPGENHSMFTGALSTSIAMSKKIEQGKLSIQDIYAGTKEIIDVWNQQNSGKAQTSIFRSSMGGDFFFRVEDYKPYIQKEISWEAKNYKVLRVDPLHAPNIKRLCAFVMLKKDEDLENLPRITKEIAWKLKYAEVYSNAASEEHFKWKSTNAVWCYFVKDENDLANHLYYVYTCWAANKELRKQYYSPNKNAIEKDGIYICKNMSYKMLKQMQKPGQNRDVFVQENRKLLASLVTLAEQFIVDMQEVLNKTITIEEMQIKYGSWIRTVEEQYLQLSELDIAPDDLHGWSEEIINLAGWILDLAYLLKNEKYGGVIQDRDRWLIQNSIKHYNQSMENLKLLEQNIGEKSANKN